MASTELLKALRRIQTDGDFYNLMLTDPARGLKSFKLTPRERQILIFAREANLSAIDWVVDEPTPGSGPGPGPSPPDPGPNPGSGPGPGSGKSPDPDDGGLTLGFGPILDLFPAPASHDIVGGSVNFEWMFDARRASFGETRFLSVEEKTPTIETARAIHRNQGTARRTLIQTLLKQIDGRSR